jgi:hypothetical protein
MARTSKPLTQQQVEQIEELKQTDARYRQEAEKARKTLDQRDLMIARLLVDGVTAYKLAQLIGLSEQYISKVKKAAITEIGGTLMLSEYRVQRVGGNRGHHERLERIHQRRRRELAELNREADETDMPFKEFMAKEREIAARNTLP